MELELMIWQVQFQALVADNKVTIWRPFGSGVQANMRLTIIEAASVTGTLTGREVPATVFSVTPLALCPGHEAITLAME